MTARILVTAVGVLLAGCLILLAAWPRASSERPPAQRALAEQDRAAPRAAAAEPLPAPSGETILRVSGVARGNVSARASELDFATLDGLAREQVTIREPFLKQDVRFTGIRMSELLRLAGSAQATGDLYFHALDDYHVKLPIQNVLSDGFLATRADGKPIEIADGGPIRLVYTSDQGLGANTDNWIWSIDSMRARG